jgi:hypothetical protein
MSLKTVFSMLAVTVVGSLSIAACAAPTDAPADQEPAAESQDQDIRMATYDVCQSDSDCVAISKGGCCPNGWDVAVNKTKVTQYENATKCENPHQVCPLYVILDTRVPQCQAGKTSVKHCQMVKPEDILCGGFVAHPRQCPTGYSCEASHVNPDFPGKCVKEVPPPPADCTTTGCPSGQYCSACWGHNACIPKGALC